MGPVNSSYSKDVLAARTTALTVATVSCFPHWQWQGAEGWSGRCCPGAREAVVAVEFEVLQQLHDRGTLFCGIDRGLGAAVTEPGHGQSRGPASVATIR